jgi:drug/metabolite transporter (DMT)-like permease
MPVMILPIEHFVLKERVRPREVMGALLTLLGVGMLFA